MKYYKKITIEGLSNLLKEIKDIPRVREFKIHTGCKTNGWTDLEIGNICANPECTSCSSFRKVLGEEINKIIE